MDSGRGVSGTVCPHSRFLHAGLGVGEVAQWLKPFAALPSTTRYPFGGLSRKSSQLVHKSGFNGSPQGDQWHSQSNQTKPQSDARSEPPCPTNADTLGLP